MLSSKIHTWKIGFMLGLAAWLILNLAFAIRLDWSWNSINGWYCGGDYHSCSYLEHFVERIPRGTFIIMMDILGNPFWAFVAMAMILVPALIGYFIDVLRSKNRSGA